MAYSDFEKFMKALPIVKAKIISVKLVNYIFIDNNDSKMYYIGEDITLRCTLDRKEKNNILFTKILELVEQFYNKLTEQEKQIIELTYKKELKSMRTNSGVKKILPNIKCYITKNNIIKYKSILNKNLYILILKNKNVRDKFLLL